jgi:iron complex transport system substrate-binding protein
MDGKKAVIWLVIVVLILTAFGSGYLIAYKEAKTQAEITLIDGVGRVVEIYETPKRVVSMASSATEILYAIGCGENIVGVDKYSDYPPDVKNKTVVGSSYSPNLEAIIGLEPDLLIAWWYARDNLLPIEDKVTVMYINPQSVEDVLQLIRQIGLIMNKVEEAEKLVEEMQSRIENITKITEDLNKSQRPLVYYELSKKGRTVGQGTFTNELIYMAGGINIAADEPFRYPDLTDEYIIARNPDVIVVVSYGASVEEIKSRNGWQNINAIKNDRVYSIDRHLVTASPRLVDGLEQLAKWFHPELFD